MIKNNLLVKLLLICLTFFIFFNSLELNSKGKFIMLPSRDLVSMPSPFTNFHFFRERVSVDFYVPDGIIGEELVIFKPSIEEELRVILENYSFINKACTTIKLNRLQNNSFEIEDVEMDVEIFDFSKNNILVPKEDSIVSRNYSEYQSAFLQMLLLSCIISNKLVWDIKDNNSLFSINMSEYNSKYLIKKLRNYISTELARLILNRMKGFTIDSFPLVETHGNKLYQNSYLLKLEFKNQMF